MNSMKHSSWIPTRWWKAYEKEIRLNSADCIIIEENEKLEDVLWKVTH